MLIGGDRVGEKIRTCQVKMEGVNFMASVAGLYSSMIVITAGERKGISPPSVAQVNKLVSRPLCRGRMTTAYLVHLVCAE